jgi:hypothetical protein
LEPDREFLAFRQLPELHPSNVGQLFSQATRVIINTSTHHFRATQDVMLRASLRTSRSLGNGSIAATAGRQWLVAQAGNGRAVTV